MTNDTSHVQIAVAISYIIVVVPCIVAYGIVMVAMLTTKSIKSKPFFQLAIALALTDNVNEIGLTLLYQVKLRKSI